MAGKISIYNLALTKCGAEPLLNSQDDCKELRLCRENYDLTRQLVLTERPWKCATARASLSALAAAPSFGADYQFHLPSDCLRLLRVEDSSGLSVEYQVEGRALLTNISALNVTYVRDLTDVTAMSLGLREAIALRLAAGIAYALVQSQELAASLLQQYLLVRDQASSVDAASSPPMVYSDSVWVTTRG